MIGLGAGRAKIATADLEAFFARLVEFSLLVPAPHLAGEALSDDLVARFAAMSEPFKVDRHDELADLLI